MVKIYCQNFRSIQLFIPNNTIMKRKILTTLVLLFFSPTMIAQAVSSEIHVTKDGRAAVSSAKVMQIAGNTFYSRLYWGDAFVRMTIKTNSATKFLRAGGEATTIAEINDGDLLDASGELQSQSDTLTLMASSVKNSSVQKEQTTLSGNVKSVDLLNRKFTLYSKERGEVTVNISTSTQFTKGNRTLDLEHVHVGDRITKTSGDYDIPTKTLATQSVVTYVDSTLFKPRNFIGKLTKTPSLTDTSIKVTVGEVAFTVIIGDKTTILRNNKGTTTLQRFIAGDSIRLYGTRREADDPVIDAEIIRNTNL